MSDLRKAAEVALAAMDYMLNNGEWYQAQDRADALRAALAQEQSDVQPEQELQLVSNLLKEYGLEALEVIAALKTQPEPMLNGLTEAETNASASVMGLTRPKPEPCADESDCDHMPWCRIRKACQKQARAALAQPEQEPVAWRYLEDPFGANEYLITDDPDTAKGPGWTPLYALPPQRKPLTEEEIAQIDWKDGETLHDFARAIEKAHGIGGEHE